MQRLNIAESNCNQSFGSQATGPKGARASVDLGEFAAWCQLEGLEIPRELAALTVPRGDHQKAATKNSPDAAPSAPKGLEPNAGLGWSLKAPTDIKRAGGYRWALYRVLKAAHDAGKPCPKAREVLEIWRANPALYNEVKVMSDGVKYDNGEGIRKDANLRAIQKAIAYLLNG